MRPSSTAAQALPYFASFVCLGLVGAALGPSLPHLAGRAGVSLAAMSSLFLLFRLGFLVGAFSGGRLYDRAPGQQVMATALVTVSVMLVAVSFVRHLAPVLGVLFVMGTMVGAVDVGGNLHVAWLPSGRIASPLNILHFSFGVGALISPLVIAVAVSLTAGIEWAYRALGLVVLPCALWLLRRPGLPGPAKAPAASARTTRPALAIAIALFLLLYVGAEAGFGGWIYTFALERGIADPVVAGYLTSVYWAAYTAGRLASVFLAPRLPYRPLLAGCLAIAVAALALLFLAPASAGVAWIAAAVFGVGLAPIFPVTVSLTAGVMHLSGRVTGLLLVGASIGGMTVPWLAGQLYGVLGPLSIPAVFLIDLLVASIVFAVIAVASGRTAAPRLRGHGGVAARAE